MELGLQTIIEGFPTESLLCSKERVAYVWWIKSCIEVGPHQPGLDGQPCHKGESSLYEWVGKARGGGGGRRRGLTRGCGEDCLKGQILGGSDEESYEVDHHHTPLPNHDEKSHQTAELGVDKCLYHLLWLALAFGQEEQPQVSGEVEGELLEDSVDGQVEEEAELV